MRLAAPRLLRAALAALALAGAAPAAAELRTAATASFVSHHAVEVAQPVAQVWRAVLRPQEWWTHTWSGDPANLSLEPRAGGCFCERIPVSDSWQVGSAEHARVVLVMPDRTLRLSGGLGPLQGEAVAATLTITLEPVAAGGTRIGWTYIVAGAGAGDLTGLGPAVDAVQGELLASLAAHLERAPAPR